MRGMVLGLLLVLCSSRAFAQQSVMLDELTASEIIDAVAAGKTTLILYTGGHHENMYSSTVNAVNGPTRDAVVISKHNIIGQYLARRVAEELGNALALGVIPYTPNGRVMGQSGNEYTGELGENPGHMRFPGTISITDETYRRLLDDIASSAIMSSHFKNVVILGDNGGGQDVMKNAAEGLNTKWEPKGVGVYFFPVYAEAKLECAKTISQLALPPELPRGSGPGGGCIIPLDDAAEVLALDPDGKFVRIHKLTVPPVGARLVTPELGRILLEQKVKLAVGHILAEVPEVPRI